MLAYQALIKIVPFTVTDDTTLLTHSPPSTTVVPYANSLDLDESPSNSVPHPDPSCLTLRQYFHQLCATLKHFVIEADEKFSKGQFIWRAIRVNNAKVQRAMNP